MIQYTFGLLHSTDINVDILGLTRGQVTLCTTYASFAVKSSSETKVVYSVANINTLLLMTVNKQGFPLTYTKALANRGGRFINLCSAP